MSGEPSEKSTASSDHGWRRWVLVIFLVTVLQLNPSHAHAQEAVIDFGAIAQAITTNSNIGITNAGIALTNVNLVLQQIQNALKSVIETAMARLKNEADRRMMQANLDQQHRLSRDGRIADIQNEHTISPASRGCSTARALSARDAQLDAEHNNANIGGSIQVARGTGSGVDSASAGAATLRLQVLAKQGVLADKGRYGTAGSSPISQMPDHKALSGDNAIYEDGDMKISSVLTPLHTAAAKVDPGALQYSLPKTFTLKNGLADFGDAQLQNDDLAYFVAYEFCDQLMPDLPTPTHGKHLTVDDIVNIRDDRANSAVRGAAADRCFAALRYRTACPAGSKDVFKSADGTSCNQIQVAMCTFMKTPAPNGMGMSPSHPSLANCETNGLSRAEFDRLLATGCHDETYLETLHRDLNARDAEHFILFECPLLETTYEMKMDHERAALEQVVSSLIATRGMGSSPSVSSRAVGTTGGGTTTP